MRKLLFITSLFSIVLFGFLAGMIFSLMTYRTHLEKMHVSAQKQTVFAALPTMQSSFSAEIITNDGRTEAVRQFFANYNSVLEPHADDIVAAADEYGLDFRLLPAIAMQESNLCKKMPVNSNNCWGFGIYGGKVTRFRDFTEAIYTVTKTLATKYKSKGLITPDQIMTMYTPGSDGSWAFSVNHFMEELQ
jgi:hypothetical protein